MGHKEIDSKSNSLVGTHTVSNLFKIVNLGECCFPLTLFKYSRVQNNECLITIQWPALHNTSNLLIGIPLASQLDRILLKHYVSQGLVFLI